MEADGGLGIPQLIIVILLAIACIAGMALHVLANRHRRPGVPAFGHKDSLFRNKSQVYTEEGMKYVRMQKGLIVVAALLAVLLLVMGTPPPPPEGG